MFITVIYGADSNTKAVRQQKIVLLHSECKRNNWRTFKYREDKQQEKLIIASFGALLL
jgi:hypothetical protein